MCGSRLGAWAPVWHAYCANKVMAIRFMSHGLRALGTQLLVGVLSASMATFGCAIQSPDDAEAKAAAGVISPIGACQGNVDGRCSVGVRPGQTEPPGSEPTGLVPAETPAPNQNRGNGLGTLGGLLFGAALVALVTTLVTPGGGRQPAEEPRASAPVVPPPGGPPVAAPPVEPAPVAVPEDLCPLNLKGAAHILGGVLESASCGPVPGIRFMWLPTSEDVKLALEAGGLDVQGEAGCLQELRGRAPNYSRFVTCTADVSDEAYVNFEYILDDEEAGTFTIRNVSRIHHGAEEPYLIACSDRDAHRLYPGRLAKRGLYDTYKEELAAVIKTAPSARRARMDEAAVRLEQRLLDFAPNRQLIPYVSFVFGSLNSGGGLIPVEEWSETTQVANVFRIGGVALELLLGPKRSIEEATKKMVFFRGSTFITHQQKVAIAPDNAVVLELDQSVSSEGIGALESEKAKAARRELSERTAFCGRN